ncbi:SPW repeat domain-containing protein [Anaeromyxobacter oryzisoli]|jgi:hypothetical protein|uniref:SPW repeat domain-containing protein n=1 Tax=Anaeromyxobacter oryzisoli TaxID=2925408 RepID=UPI001F58E3ED|nr:hypothetical protein [Anaeromyxobacter sp. SG63]
MFARWLNVLFGVWFLATAFIAGPGSPEFGNHVFLGLAIFLLAFLAMGYPGFRLLTFLLGGWAIVAPFALHYAATGFAVHDMALGALVMWSAATATRAPGRRRGPPHVELPPGTPP